MANSADPDQLASEKPTDLDLYCLQKQDISGFSRTGVDLSRIKMSIFEEFGAFKHILLKVCWEPPPCACKYHIY